MCYKILRAGSFVVHDSLVCGPRFNEQAIINEMGFGRAVHNENLYMVGLSSEMPFVKKNNGEKDYEDEDED